MCAVIDDVYNTYPFEWTDSESVMVGCKGEIQTHCVNTEHATCYTHKDTEHCQRRNVCHCRKRISTDERVLLATCTAVGLPVFNTGQPERLQTEQYSQDVRYNLASSDALREE